MEDGSGDLKYELGSESYFNLPFTHANILEGNNLSFTMHAKDSFKESNYISAELYSDFDLDVKLLTKDGRHEYKQFRRIAMGPFTAIAETLVDSKLHKMTWFKCVYPELTAITCYELL
jgi:hypothetical protein